MTVSLILLGIFIAVSFALWREGPWSGLIVLLNVLLAASLATAWYPVVVARLEPSLASYTHLLDFIALQGMFCVLLILMREITDRLSRTGAPISIPRGATSRATIRRACPAVRIRSDSATLRLRVSAYITTGTIHARSMMKMPAAATTPKTRLG